MNPHGMKTSYGIVSVPLNSSFEAGSKLAEGDGMEIEEEDDLMAQNQAQDHLPQWADDLDYIRSSFAREEDKLVAHALGQILSGDGKQHAAECLQDRAYVERIRLIILGFQKAGRLENYTVFVDEMLAKMDTALQGMKDTACLAAFKSHLSKAKVVYRMQEVLARSWSLHATITAKRNLEVN